MKNSRDKFLALNAELELNKGESKMSGMMEKTENRLSNKGLLTMAVAASLFFSLAVPSTVLGTVLWSDDDKGDKISFEIKDKKAFEDAVNSFFKKDDDDKITGFADKKDIEKALNKQKDKWDAAQWSNVMKDVVDKAHEEKLHEKDDTTKKSAIDNFLEEMKDLDINVVSSKEDDIEKRRERDNFVAMMKEVMSFTPDELKQILNDEDKFLKGVFFKEDFANKFGFTLEKPEKVAETEELDTTGELAQNETGEQGEDEETDQGDPNKDLVDNFTKCINKVAEGMKAIGGAVGTLQALYNDLANKKPEPQPSQQAQPEREREENPFRQDILNQLAELQNSKEALDELANDDFLAGLQPNLDGLNGQNQQGAQADPGAAQQAAAAAPAAAPSSSRRGEDELALPENSERPEPIVPTPPFTPTPIASNAQAPQPTRTAPLLAAQVGSDAKKSAAAVKDVEQAADLTLAESKKKENDQNLNAQAIVNEKNLMNSLGLAGPTTVEIELQNQLDRNNRQIGVVKSELTAAQAKLKGGEELLASIPGIEGGQQAIAKAIKAREENGGTLAGIEKTLAQKEKELERIKQSNQQLAGAGPEAAVQNQQNIQQAAALENQIVELQNAQRIQKAWDNDAATESNTSIRNVMTAMTDIKSSTKRMTQQLSELEDSNGKITGTIRNGEQLFLNQFNQVAGSGMLNNRTGVTASPGVGGFGLQNTAVQGPRTSPGGADLTSQIAGTGSRSGSFKRGGLGG